MVHSLGFAVAQAAPRVCPWYFVDPVLDVVCSEGLVLGSEDEPFCLFLEVLMVEPAQGSFNICTIYLVVPLHTGRA